MKRLDIYIIFKQHCQTLIADLWFLLRLAGSWHSLPVGAFRGHKSNKFLIKIHFPDSAACIKGDKHFATSTLLGKLNVTSSTVSVSTFKLPCSNSHSSTIQVWLNINLNSEHWASVAFNSRHDYSFQWSQHDVIYHSNKTKPLQVCNIFIYWIVQLIEPQLLKFICSLHKSIF